MKIRRDPWLRGFLKGIKAGAVGAILAATISLSQITFPDLPTAAIAAVSMLAILKFKVNLSLLVVIAGALGILMKLF